MKKAFGICIILLLIMAAGCVQFESDEDDYTKDKGEITARAGSYQKSQILFSTTVPTTVHPYFSLYTRDLYVYANASGEVWPYIAERAYPYGYYGPIFWMVWYPPFDDFPVLHLQEEGKGRDFGRALKLAREYSYTNFNYYYGDVVLGPQTVMGCSVERKIYVNPTASQDTHDDYIRWLEILTNNTDDTKKLDIVMGGQLLFKNSPVITATSDGDLVPEPLQDSWVISQSSYLFSYRPTYYVFIFGAPYFINLFDGPYAYDGLDSLTMIVSGDTIFDWEFTGEYDVNTATKTADIEDIVMSYRDVKLKPGETKILMHYAILSETDPGYDFFFDEAGGDYDDAVASAEHVTEYLASALRNMDKEEINAVINMPVARGYCNVQGSAGAVDEDTLVKAKNLRTGEEQRSYSLKDGSFGICIDAVLGDEIEVEWDDEEETVIVE